MIFSTIIIPNYYSNCRNNDYNVVFYKKMLILSQKVVHECVLMCYSIFIKSITYLKVHLDH